MKLRLTLRLNLGLTLAIAGLVVLAGCGSGGPPKVSAPTSGDRAGCARLIAALPAQVANQARVHTTGYQYAAAWGKPAIVLRCGVGLPKGYTQTAGCQLVNGIGWFLPDDQVSDNSAHIVATTLHRKPAVEVTVPASYRPQGPSEAMVDLAKLLATYTKASGNCA